MSRVTNAVLTAHVSRKHSDPEIDSVNKFLREAEGGGGGKFVETTRDAGGPKRMECRVYLSAFNHADTEVILRAVDQAPWQDKAMVQLFVKEQEQGEFLLRFHGHIPQPSLTVNLTSDELGIINNALNEVCNGVELEGDFDTRMGCTIEEARALLAKIHTLGSS